MRWSASSLCLYLIPKMSTTSVKFMSLSVCVHSPWVILFWCISVRLEVLLEYVMGYDTSLHPDHTFPSQFLHRCICRIDFWVSHICRWSIGGLSWALSWYILPCSLDCSGISSWHQQWGISHLAWTGHCYNEVWLLSNILWGWRLGPRVKVYCLPLWVALCGFRSSRV